MNKLIEMVESTSGVLDDLENDLKLVFDAIKNKKAGAKNIYEEAFVTATIFNASVRKFIRKFKSKEAVELALAIGEGVNLPKFEVIEFETMPLEMEMSKIIAIKYQVDNFLENNA